MDGDERDRGAVGWGMGAFHKYSATCFYTRYSQDFQLTSGPDIVWALSSVSICLSSVPTSLPLVQGVQKPQGSLTRSSRNISRCPEWRSQKFNIREPCNFIPHFGLLEPLGAPYLQTSLHFLLLPRILPVAFDLLLVLCLLSLHHTEELLFSVRQWLLPTLTTAP